MHLRLKLNIIDDPQRRIVSESFDGEADAESLGAAISQFLADNGCAEKEPGTYTIYVEPFDPVARARRGERRQRGHHGDTAAPVPEDPEL